MPEMLPVLPTHNAVIFAMRDLGYLSSKEGICGGLAYMWGQAVLSGRKEEERFTERIKFISDPQFLEKMKIYLATKEQKYPADLSANDLQQLHDILPFLDSVEIYQQSVRHAYLFEKDKAPSHAAVTSLSLLPASIQIENQGGIISLDKTIEEIRFSKENLIDYFEAWRIAITKTLKDDKEEKIKDGANDLIIRLVGNKHATALRYDLEKKSWVHMDANLMPPTEIKPQDLADRIWSSHFNSDKDSISLMPITYTTKNNTAAADLKTEFMRVKSEGVPKIIKVPIIKDNKRKPESLAPKNQKASLAEKYQPPKKIDMTSTLTAAAFQILSTEEKSAIITNIISRQNISQLTKLLNLKIDLNKADSSGNTPLDLIIKHNFYEAFDTIKDCGISFENTRNPLHVAISKNNSEVIPYLYDFYNQKDDKGIAPLQLAVETRNTDATSILLQCGAETNIVDNRKNTIIHLAALNNGFECLELMSIAEEYKSFNNDLNKPNIDNKKPLDLALENKHYEVAADLLRLGAHLDDFPYKKRLLYNAAKQENIKLTTELLDKKYGLDVNADPDNNGRTPLAEAVWHSNFALIKILLLAGANYKNKEHPDLEISFPNASSFAGWLAANNQLDLLKTLIDRDGIEVVNEKGPNNKSAVSEASITNNSEILSFLNRYDTKPALTAMSSTAEIVLGIASIKDRSMIKTAFTNIDSKHKNEETKTPASPSNDSIYLTPQSPGIPSPNRRR